MNLPHRQLAAIMFTDIVGYSALMGRNENEGLKILRLNREVHKSCISEFQGNWLKEMGDGTIAWFGSALQAVNCACEIQKKLQSHGRWKLRIGIHLGDIAIENQDIFGDGVNIASRLESIADPGGIYVSDAVIRSIRAHEEIGHTRLGSFNLKNVPYPVEVFSIQGPGLPIPSKQKMQDLSGEKDGKGLKRRSFIIASFLLVFALLIGFIRIFLFPAGNLGISSIAVLPLANLTGDQEQEYFVAGMHDALITELSKIGSLRIISRQSTLRFGGSTLPMKEIAKQLTVDAVVEGSVFKSGNEVVIQIQLIKPNPRETHILGTSYQRQLSDVINLHKEITRDIAETIQVKLTAGEKSRMQDTKRVDPGAYEAYLKGTFHWNKLTREDLDIAEKYYRLSVEIDPDYALGYVGLAAVGLGRGQMGYMPWLEMAQMSVHFLNEAMALDSTLAEVHFLSAAFNMWGFWEWEKAEEEFIRSININPNYALALTYYSQFLCWINKPEDGLAHMAKALDLDPYNTLYKEVYGMNLLFTKRYGEAQELLEGILETDPESRISLTTLRSVYHMQKKYDKAFAMWKRTYPNDPEALAALDSGYREGGYEMALQRLAETLIERSKVKYVPAWWIGTIYTRADMKNEALNWLKKAYSAHDPNMPSIHMDPIFDYMRDDPEFIALVDKMNFPE